MCETKEARTLVLQIREVLRDHTVEISEMSTRMETRVYRKLIHVFSAVGDPRQSGMVEYNLSEILLMVFLSMLGGADACTEMERFWVCRPKVYRRIFRKDMVPSHDTFRRILGILKPDEVNAATVSAISESTNAIRKAFGLKPVKMAHYSVDGKQLKGTGREDTATGPKRDLQTLNIYDNYNGTCLCTAAIDEKSNEIPKAQELLSGMCLNDTVVTFDALHTQKETARVISERGGHYVGGLKGNQPTLNAFAESLFTGKAMDRIRESGDDYLETKEISHNQYEERRFYLKKLTPLHKETTFEGWSNAKALVRYDKTTVGNNTGKTGAETRYYLTSLTNVVQASDCIRGHWGVENNLHNGLDTVMMEDMMELSDRTAATNKSILHKMCLQLLTLVQSVTGQKGKYGKKTIRKSFGWAFEDQMKEMLTLIDPYALKCCLTIVPKEKRAKKTKE